MPIEKLRVRIRNPVEEDRNFIVGAWLQSYKDKNPISRDIRWSVYKPTQERVIIETLNRSQTLIACLEENQNEIVGFMCSERINGVLVVHYCYTSSVYRRSGVQRDELLKAFGYKIGEDIICSHWTYVCRKVGLQRRWRIHYMPEIVRQVVPRKEITEEEKKNAV